jgi:hypothetical protein
MTGHRPEMGLVIRRGRGLFIAHNRTIPSQTVVDGITEDVVLTPCSDLSSADWIVSSDLPWERLVGFGPSGFAAYARVRFLPDPAFAGQSENDVDVDPAYSDNEQLRMLADVLAARTTTPQDCYVCVWDGYGEPRLAPAGPKVVVPHREYHLYRGPLGNAGDASPTDMWPAFVWPADRAWCVARDVDPHWAGIGADAQVIEQLVTHSQLDVVLADPNQAQPTYY